MENVGTVTVGGQSFEVRGLLRKEVKALRKEHGIYLSALSPSIAEEAMDRVFDLILTDDQIQKLDDLPNAEAVAVWKKIIDLTYGNKDQEKN